MLLFDLQKLKYGNELVVNELRLPNLHGFEIIDINYANVL